MRGRIVAACERVGRDPSGVRLIGVTKGHDADEIRHRLVDRGLLDLGENRAQEWRDKAADLPSEIRWHFVGSLQRNKVKYLADGGVSTVHSLNSRRLADAMQDQGQRRDHRFEALIEVDVAGEDAKQGVASAEVASLLRHCRDLSHVEVIGLMAIAPFADDPEQARPYFRELGRLADELGLAERSMGMSGDFEVAIEEGATMVRIGTALFESDAVEADPVEADPEEGAT
ncbi:MAG: YggS family pyridoxal phosphate-dependent enzyme [Trueperaceae bacterium]|nr:YggS family pyridoxal phosphate-dependent enzyme [Trueperaceae bacterium]